MRTFISSLFILLLTFGLTMSEASAKRFGGGKSFGVQRSQSSLFNQHKAKPAPSSMAQKAGAGSKWGGMLGGLLVGGLLASLFMGNGLGTGLITWLILGAVLFFAINFFRKRMQPGYQSAAAPPAFNQNSFKDFTQAFNNNNNSGGGSSSSGYPAGFDADAFLRQAKVMFLRLQAAYDQNNIDDLKAFTAPEIFGEIQMQIEERGNARNNTEVSQLEAELLDASKQSFSTIASVRFTGLLKENDEPTTKLDEIWHFRQFEPNGEWVVGGIQQEVVQPS